MFNKFKSTKEEKELVKQMMTKGPVDINDITDEELEAFRKGMRRDLIRKALIATGITVGVYVTATMIKNHFEDDEDVTGIDDNIFEGVFEVED